MNRIHDAIAAYSAAAAAPATAPVAAPAQGGESFAGMVKNAVEGAVETVGKSEEISKQAIAGKADVRDLVTAVTNAELTLQTVVSVRDKVITAYNEILKMPI